MIRIEITGRNPFLCPVGWTVEQAEWKIRSSYEVTDGHVEKYGIPMSVDETLTVDGDYRFVNFRSLQGTHQDNLFSTLVESLFSFVSSSSTSIAHEPAQSTRPAENDSYTVSPGQQLPNSSQQSFHSAQSFNVVEDSPPPLETIPMDCQPTNENVTSTIATPSNSLRQRKVMKEES